MNSELDIVGPMEPSTSRIWLHWAVLGAILLLGTVLRTYNLASQSVWYDEYISASYLDRPDLLSCLNDQRAENWEMVPLYYTLEYYWAKCVGGTMTGVRCLSVLFGVAALFVAYRLGSLLHSSDAGLLAAFWMALSPFHIFHAQGIRPYAMVTFLALVSAYAFWMAVNDGGRKWWVLSILMNLLLFWTHLLTVLVLLPQGCFLLIFRRRPFRRVLIWAGIHLALLMPVILWTTTIHFVPNNLKARFRQDIRGIVYFLPFALKTLHSTRNRGIEATWFLLLWWLVPWIAVFALTLFLTNCLAERYVIYCSPAMYILVSGAFLSLRRPVLRAGATSILLFAIILHAWLSASTPSRTDYLSAARLIREGATPNDAVIVHTWFQRPIVAFNMHTTPDSLKCSDDLNDLCAQTDAELRQGNALWTVIVEEPWSVDVIKGYESYLADKAIRFTEDALPGMQYIYVFHSVPAGPDGASVAGG